jgi:hypothetical protein
VDETDFGSCPTAGFWHSRCFNVRVVGFGGLVVIILAIGPKVRGFKPDRGRWVSKGDKNP